MGTKYTPIKLGDKIQVSGLQLNQSVLKTDQDADTQWIDDVFRTIMNLSEEKESRKFIHRWYERYGEDNATVNFMHDNDKESRDDPFYSNLFLSKRRMIAQFLLALRNHANNEVAIPDMPQPLHNKYFDVCYVENDLTDDYLKKKWKNVVALKATAPGTWDWTLEMMDVVTDYLNIKPVKQYYDKDACSSAFCRRVARTDVLSPSPALVHTSTKCSTRQASPASSN